MTSVTVIDYNAGNLLSVVRAFRHIGGDVRVTADADEIESANRLVLPGVGAFGKAAGELVKRRLTDPIRRFVDSGRPFLGICLGMQLMFESSSEQGEHAGLALLAGRVERITSTDSDGRRLKVPHIGWNALVMPPDGSWEGTILDGIASPPELYFVHSYAARPVNASDRLADVVYGGHRFCAAVCRDNLIGFQCHPEKSGPTGLAALRRFLGT